MDQERLIHSIKAVIAVIIGTVLARTIVGPPADQWVVITILVVMCAQIYVGSVIRKVYLRFIGTIIGCLFAAITLATLGHTYTSILIAIALSTFIFSYFAIGQESFGYAGTLGAVTTVIIMLGQSPTLLFAIQRLLEISAGLLIAALVSQFILPIHASTHLRRAQANTLQQLRDYYALAMNLHLGNQPLEDLQDLDENIAKSLIKQRQLAKESASEPLSSAFNPVKFMQSLQCEREMLRAISLMHAANIELRRLATPAPNVGDVQIYNEPIMEAFNTLIRVVAAEKDAPAHIHLPSILPLIDRLYAKEYAQLPPDSSSIPTKPVANLAVAAQNNLYLEGFLFSMNNLLSSISKLATLLQVKVYST